jgi:hypothetical protein
MLGRRREDEAVVDIEDPSMILFRRLWPNPDEERLPGGVLTVIAEDISIFQIRFFDGEQWADEWPEEMETMPELLEVSLGTVPEDLGDPILETFVVNCTRLEGRSSAPASDEEESEGGARAEEPQDEQPSGEQGAGGNVRAR